MKLTLMTYAFDGALKLTLMTTYIFDTLVLAGFPLCTEDMPAEAYMRELDYCFGRTYPLVYEVLGC